MSKNSFKCETSYNNYLSECIKQPNQTLLNVNIYDLDYSFLPFSHGWKMSRIITKAYKLVGGGVYRHKITAPLSSNPLWEEKPICLVDSIVSSEAISMLLP